MGGGKEAGPTSLVCVRFSAVHHTCPPTSFSGRFSFYLHSTMLHLTGATRAIWMHCRLANHRPPPTQQCIQRNMSGGFLDPSEKSSPLTPILTGIGTPCETSMSLHLPRPLPPSSMQPLLPMLPLLLLLHWLPGCSARPQTFGRSPARR